MLAELQLVFSVSIYVSLSQRSPEHSFYYCLQSYSPSLPNSVADSRPSLQAVKFTVNASFYYVTSTRMRK